MRNVFRSLGLTLILLALASGWSLNADAAGNSAGRTQQLASSMLKDIGHSTWISEGKGPHVIYIFFDPNCPYCHHLYENTRSWIKQGKVQLRWIPVGILTPTSGGKAAAILGAKDPRKAFYYNENHYHRGGAIDEDIPSSTTEKKLKANASLLSRTGVGAVPVLLFKAKDGTPYLIEGSPRKNKLKIILAHVK